MRQQHQQHPVTCQLPVPTMTSTDHTQHWLPQHDPEPTTEVLSGDLYLLAAAAECSSNSKCTTNSSSSNRSNDNNNNNRSRGDSAGVTKVRCPVHVQIHRSCFGHFAVVSASLRAPATFLNLRSCNARPCPPSNSNSSSSSSFSVSSPSSDGQQVKRFRVELGGGEGQVVYFEVCPSSARGKDNVSVDEWVRAFQGSGVPSPGNISPSLSPVIPRNTLMPTLQESIEEEEEEEKSGEGED